MHSWVYKGKVCGSTFTLSHAPLKKTFYIPMYYNCLSKLFLLSKYKNFKKLLSFNRGNYCFVLFLLIIWTCTFPMQNFLTKNIWGNKRCLIKKNFKNWLMIKNLLFLSNQTDIQGLLLVLIITYPWVNHFDQVL